jgi:hypothetical protein
MPRKKVIKETLEESVKSLKDRISHYWDEIRERDEQIEKENREKEKIELDRRNVILLLDVHRSFAKESLFGYFETLKMDGSIKIIESEEFKELKSNKLIDFMTFAHLMESDDMIYSYCEDMWVNDFRRNLIKRYEYNGQDLEWNISIIDIKILFDELRENQFISSDTPRSIFFEIFNPNLSVFHKPIQWNDIKELVYFFDKCIEYGFIKNYKYQSLIEKYKMFTTKRSEGNYIKSGSLRSTLSDVKNESLKTVAFEQRIKLIDEFMDYVTM